MYCTVLYHTRYVASVGVLPCVIGSSCERGEFPLKSSCAEAGAASGLLAREKKATVCMNNTIQIIIIIRRIIIIIIITLIDQNVLPGLFLLERLGLMMVDMIGMPRLPHVWTATILLPIFTGPFFSSEFTGRKPTDHEQLGWCFTIP
jgi:hypothetical protein